MRAAHLLSASHTKPARSLARASKVKSSFKLARGAQVTDSNTDNKYAYVSYSSTAGGVQDAFYTDAQCSAAYQAHLLTMVNRVNTITGVVRAWVTPAAATCKLRP